MDHSLGDHLLLLLGRHAEVESRVAFGSRIISGPLVHSQGVDASCLRLRRRSRNVRHLGIARPSKVDSDCNSDTVGVVSRGVAKPNSLVLSASDVCAPIVVRAGSMASGGRWARQLARTVPRAGALLRLRLAHDLWSLADSTVAISGGFSTYGTGPSCCAPYVRGEAGLRGDRPAVSWRQHGTDRSEGPIATATNGVRSCRVLQPRAEHVSREASLGADF